MLTKSDKEARGSKPRKSNSRRGNGSPPAAAPSEAAALIDLYPPEPGTRTLGAQEFLRARPLADSAGLSKAQLVEVYRYLFETRRLEEHLTALYRQNQVVGGLYRSLGQEATAVGCAYALRDGDYMQPLIRDVGAMLTHGATPLAFLRQYMARATGPSGGRDLNTHFSSPEAGILGPVSMLGAMIPVMCGCLWAARLKKEHKVGLAFIGDGGSSTGAFYEGVNLAAVHKLPLIVVIEANQYAYSTPTVRQVPDGDLVRRARGFGCTVAHFDGNDVLACYQATRDARARALAGGGPSILVAETYRRKGHAEHDNQSYVPAGEVDDWAGHNDPFERYLRFVIDGGHASEVELEEVRTEIEAGLAAARDQAMGEPFPDPATQEHAVFADTPSAHPPLATWFRGGPPRRSEGDRG